MEILNKQIFKIDIQNETVDVHNPNVNEENIIEYLKEVFKIVLSDNYGRNFKFDRDTTEVCSQIISINQNGNFDEATKNIAQRLLKIESQTEQRVSQIAHVLKGLVVQAKIKINNQNKFIICKIDDNEFLDKENYTKKEGLPYKNKIFKAFVCNMNLDNLSAKSYDTNSKISVYWWRDFLELSMIYTDEDNTKNAFNTIDNKVISKIKKKHPVDHRYLRNSTVKYFRSNDTFDINSFINDVLSGYVPFDNNLKIETLKSEIQDLPLKKNCKFDSQFHIIKNEIKAKFTNRINLTDDIELHLKTEAADSSIKAEKDQDGTKCIKIKSKNGYEYFRKKDEIN